MEVTIGGNRVGSGKKMQAHLHNYNRSTHNLSETFASSMTCGVLYPALCKLAMRGDSFDININADCRTIPTVGPLFGSFKMQVDVYQCPVRLYQGILHNNPLAIGLKMQQVKFPLLDIRSNDNTGIDHKNMRMNTSSLMHYMGMSGLGTSVVTNTSAGRKINALPFLSYYDIFKTYYANKQEELAYVVTAKAETINVKITNAYYYYTITNRNRIQNNQATIQLDTLEGLAIEIQGKNFNSFKDSEEIPLNIELIDGNETTIIELEYSFHELWNNANHPFNDPMNSAHIKGVLYGDSVIKIYLKGTSTNLAEAIITIGSIDEEIEINRTLDLQEFNLSNIDDMRYDLLSHHTLGTAFEIKDDENAYLPYKVLVEKNNNGVMLNTYPLNGLVLKTYQNDIFNNWLNTEWIEGENSITELTKVAIVNGAFSMDSLNFAQKQYNMLNRIATAGATYEDWQDVVYEEVKRRQIESPMFVGGMSQEVVFDEIVQNAPASVDGVTSQLGDLGGRGKLLNNKKGGKIHIKCDEACFIIAIVSLTPRVYQTQGNEFYLTDVLSLDDMHKPPMDGIGFQDLIGERMAWWDTKIINGSTELAHRSKIGKLPAWIEYMTSYDRAHGDFAEETAGYMILSRRYEMSPTATIKDATTYIDPTKFNYAFAYKDLDSQNFWVQIAFNIKARRLMSARLIPNV